ncbi:hypothetical protein VZO05_12305 [Aggregatilineales bacterium SYSU G02658]
MSDDRPFRRLRRADRKREIKADRSFLKQDMPDDLPDLSMLTADDTQDVEQLAAIPEGVIARPLKIAPPEERFPPIAPPDEPPAAAALPAAPRARPQPPRRTGLNLLTLGLLLATAALWLGVAQIWQDPYHWLNPLPPPRVLVVVTATFLPPTATPNLPPTPEGSLAFPFALAQGVTYRANDNERACEWASIAGSVVDASGVGLTGYRVQIVGEAGSTTVFSGTAAAFGAGGFEFQLGDAPVEAAFLVQLLGFDGQPLSDVIALQTRPTCDENVALLRFRPQ